MKYHIRSLAINRTKFFDIMFNEKIAPANAVDRMKPLIQESIKKTVG